MTHSKVEIKPAGKLEKKKGLAEIGKRLYQERALYALFLPVFLYYLIFSYLPLGGIVLAFKKYSPVYGIWGSEWIGFDNFIKFFSNYNFGRILWNTIRISLCSILFNFPAPILLALMLNEVRVRWLRRRCRPSAICRTSSLWSWRSRRITDFFGAGRIGKQHPCDGRAGTDRLHDGGIILHHHVCRFGRVAADRLGLHYLSRRPSAGSVRTYMRRRKLTERAASARCITSPLRESFPQQRYCSSCSWER